MTDEFPAPTEYSALDAAHHAIAVFKGVAALMFIGVALFGAFAAADSTNRVALVGYSLAAIVAIGVTLGLYGLAVVIELLRRQAERPANQ